MPESIITYGFSVFIDEGRKVTSYFNSVFWNKHISREVKREGVRDGTGKTASAV